MKNFYNFYRGLKALKTLANKLEVDPSLYGEENLAVERQLEFLIKNHPQLKNRVVFKIEITDDGTAHWKIEVLNKGIEATRLLY